MSKLLLPDVQYQYQYPEPLLSSGRKWNTFKDAHTKVAQECLNYNDCNGWVPPLQRSMLWKKKEKKGWWRYRCYSAGAVRRAKLQSNRHHQQTNTQLFMGRMSLLSFSQKRRTLWRKNLRYFTDLLTASLPGGLPILPLTIINLCRQYPKIIGDWWQICRKMLHFWIRNRFSIFCWEYLCYDNIYYSHC